MTGFQSAGAFANLGLALRADHDPDGARSAFEEGLRLSRRAGSKVRMAEALRGLACLAADMGDWHRAATLHGTAQALLDQTGIRVDPVEATNATRASTGIATAIGDEQLQACLRPRHGAQPRSGHRPRTPTGSSRLNTPWRPGTTAEPMS